MIFDGFDIRHGQYSLRHLSAFFHKNLEQFLQCYFSNIPDGLAENA